MLGKLIGFEIDLGIGGASFFVNEGDLVWIAFSALLEEMVDELMVHSSLFFATDTHRLTQTIND